MDDLRASGEVTRLLAEIEAGHEDAAPKLFPVVYEELRSIAESCLRRERVGHTLQPTALVHEAFLKLVGQTEARLESRKHFFVIAATAMRRVLVHHAEKRGAAKRGGDRLRVDTGQVEPLVQGDGPSNVDLLALDEALTRLAELDPRKARVVELRFFAGSSIEETAEVLGSSPATVKRDWEFAKTWLLHEIEGAP